MDIELIKALGDLPITALLIYLLVRQQGENEKLLTQLIESERCHARNIIDIISRDRNLLVVPSDNP